MIATHQMLLAIAALLLLAVLASKASQRLGVPALLAFLVLGMLAGSDGPGGIAFDNAAIAQFIGVVALAFILFAGGLDTEWQQVRHAVREGIALSTAGVVITALATGAFAIYALDMPLLEGMLLGAIVSSTDAAAVFSVLRSHNVRLKARVKAVLELESGSNDPMAVFLTIGLLRLIQEPGASWLELVPLFLLQMSIGLAAGYGAGWLMVQLVNRLNLQYEGLYPVLMSGFVLFTYGATELAWGNGFLAVYVAGLVMGNARFLHKRSLLYFSDSLAWLMQIAMFFVLGLLVFPSRIVPVIPQGLAMSVFLMLVARPVGAFIPLMVSRLTFREKVMVAWVGLRGAVPIILATFPMLAGLGTANMIFHIVFFVVLTSALLQGTSVARVAKWLGLATRQPPKRYYPIEFEPAASSDSRLIDVPVSETSPIAGKPLVDISLPRGALAVLINRDGKFVVPRGSTVVQAGDVVLFLVEADAVNALRARVGVEPEAA